MKYLICILLFFSTSLQSQTYISPVIGYDRLKLVDEGRVGTVNLLEESEILWDFIGGAEFSQAFFNGKIELSFQLLYRKRFTPALIRGGVPQIGLDFKDIRKSIFLTWHLSPKYYLGIGGSLNKMGCITPVLQHRDVNFGCDHLSVYEDIDNKSISLNIGRSIKNLRIQLGYTFMEDIEIDPALGSRFEEPFMERSSALTLTVAYRFKILDRITFRGLRKKSGCPTDF